MTPYLLIEVLGGPLDGLRTCGEKNKISIGRQVGNSLTLAIDQAVSGYHAEVVLEGNVWCLRDLGSTNGTWFKGNRLEPKVSTPLESEDQILVGTNTVLRILLAEKAVVPISFNAHQVDLRKIQDMEEDFAGFWEGLYEKCPPYLDSGILFNHLGQDQQIGLLAGFFQHQDLADIIDSWIEQKRSANRAYRLDPDILTVAPRVLQFFEEVKKKDSRLSVRGFIDAVLAERQVRGRDVKSLQLWLENYKTPVKSSAVDPVPVSPPEKKEVAAPVVSSPDSPPVSPSASVEKVVAEEKKQSEQSALFLDFVLQTEKIVLGFIKDAMHPTSVPEHFALPGFASTAEEILDKSEEKKTAEFFKEYLPVLISSLKVVLVAQREGANNYPGKLDEQLTDILEEINKGSMFDQFRQSSNLSPADRIRGVLKSAETSGLGEHLIRERIREKMKIIRLTREEKS
jgi:hypothetical protein